MSQNIQNKVYVVRRPLKPLKSFSLTVQKTAHSALLVYIEDKYTLIQYMDDGKVYIHDIPAKDVKEDSFNFQGYNWDKQKIGKELGPNIKSPQQIAQQMKQIMSLQNYSLFNHNCHIAQESTRYKLGLAKLQDLSYEFQVQIKLLKKIQNLQNKLKDLENNLNENDYDEVQVSKKEISSKIIKQTKTKITQLITYNHKTQNKLKPAVQRKIDLMKEQINTLQDRLKQDPKRMTQQDLFNLITIQNCF